MIKKLCIIVSFIVMAFYSESQLEENKLSIRKTNQPQFYLYYAFAGLGSNMGRFEPTLRAKGTSFIYTYEQNSYYGKKNNRIDTICIGKFRQSSVDSIINLVKNLNDTTIYRTNPGIMSGGIHFLTVVAGRDSTKFELGNTFDYTALKIVNIINTYLPKDKKLWANEEMIKREEEFWKEMRQKTKQEKPSKISN